MKTPVLICTGFLDSGKTTFIKETLMTQDWIADGPTLLITCEEGEKEYEKEYLDDMGMFLFALSDEAELNTDFLKNCEKIYHPSQVVIEYNGMWDLGNMMSKKLPGNWEIQGVYSTVNGETLDMYLLNMKTMLMNQLNESELIVINRCGENTNRSAFRRAIRIQNPQAQLIFEGTDGKIIPQMEEDLPFDVKAEEIVIGDEDYGIWFADMYDHPQWYDHKKLRFLAQLFRVKGMPGNMFIPGRQIMTCCAQDVQFYGFPCVSGKEETFKQRGWARVLVRCDFESERPGEEKQPILKLLQMEPEKRPKKVIVSLT